MQNNEFEKQVQERLGQIKFTPSDAVWAEVEKNLKQRRKRRVAVLWFFLCFMIAGGASLGWLYLSPGNSATVNHQSSQIQEQPKKETPSDLKNKSQQIPQSSDKKELITGDDNSKTDSQENSNAEKNKQYSTTVIAGSQKNNVNTISIKKQKNKNQSIAISNKEKRYKSPVEKKGETGSDVNIDVAAGAVVKAKNDAVSNDQINNVDESVAKNDHIAPDSLTATKDSIAKLAKIKVVDSSAASAPTVKIKASSKSKWQFGVSAGFGMSDIVNMASSQKSLAMASNNVSAPGYSTGAIQNPAFYISPSELNSSFQFSLGFVAAKKIQKRMTLNVGLQYHYYSMSIKVGPRIDSSSSPIYLAAGPRINNHQDKYHFIELPVTLGIQLLKNKPLQLNTGISLGQLLASNVLTYDNLQGVYYKDKSNLNKTQLNLLLGLSWTFGEKSRTPVQFGPNFSYGASNLSNKSLNGSNHMYTLGADIKILFRKK